jgi:glycosyltransferase involved in cell wall biosynthesis
MPTVAVIVAARDAAATIDACLQALGAQTWHDHAVIVVDDGSTDDTGRRAADGGAHVVRTNGVGASAARNAGLAETRADVVAFTDADCTPVPHWLASLLEGLEWSRATGVGGPQRNVFPTGRSRADAFDAFFRLAAVVSDYTRSGGRIRRVTHNASCNSAYRREAVVAVGGFRPGLWPGEDVDLDLRLARQGGTFAFVPEALVLHHRPGTLTWFRRMMRRYGAAERELVALHGRARRIDYLPAITVAVAALHLLYLWAPARPWLAATDGVAATAAGLALAATTPPRHWLEVIVFTVVAMWEWHRGWWSPATRRAVHDPEAAVRAAGPGAPTPTVAPSTAARGEDPA